MSEPKNNSISKAQVVLRFLPYLVGIGVVAVAVMVIGIQVWEYGNSVEFCTEVCHDVHPEEPAAFQDSYHAGVKCTECHMGRLGTIHSLILKASHFQHIPEVLFDNYERPIESETMRPANESCERCHWPPAFHGDTVREIKQFEPDEENTEKRTYLILSTGAGERESGLGYGIHWHITNPVEYIAIDGEHNQDIRWVQTTLPDGRTVEYNDVTDPLSPEEIAAADKQTMDCVSCHNRVGHPFDPPDKVIDRALSTGRLDSNLPYIKREMASLLRSECAECDSLEEALEIVNGLQDRYKAEHPEVAAGKVKEIAQASALAKELLPRLMFEEPGVTWESFPDNNKHLEFAGCFRCHDGKHLSEDGESIRLHCNICHSIPLVVDGNVRPPQMPVVPVQEPPSHLETNWMADHRFEANEFCEACHGVIEFGADDSSFCANSACHGQAWPQVDLNAAFPHPVELEGKHAETWCHDCHAGVKKPSYECANCHEAPAEVHFGDGCEDCHSPAGFEQVNVTDFEHPTPLEGAHAKVDCATCHTGNESAKYECSTCHQPAGEAHYAACEMCHRPEGFGRAELPPHPMSLRGRHTELTCFDCHSSPSFGAISDYTCGDCHQKPHEFGDDDCTQCHSDDKTWGELGVIETFQHPEPWQKAMELHAKVTCQGCHFQGYDDLSTRCGSCHE